MPVRKSAIPMARVTAGIVRVLRAQSVDRIATPRQACAERAIIGGPLLGGRSALLTLRLLRFVLLTLLLIGAAHPAEQASGRGADRRPFAGIASNRPTDRTNRSPS